MIYIPGGKEGESCIKGFDTELLDLLIVAAYYHEIVMTDPCQDDMGRRAHMQQYLKLAALREVVRAEVEGGTS